MIDNRELHDALNRPGPLSREVAAAALRQAADLMATADFSDALRIYQRVIGVDDVGLTASALLGSGEAFHRLDDDRSALVQWEAATRLAENPLTYGAWRNVAAARVRGDDLPGAVAAYKEAERRAPREDRAEISARLGWLTKELGDTGASGRYFARARGDMGLSLALVVMGVTIAVSLLANFLPADTVDLYGILAMDKQGLAHGELWRLWTVTLVHAPLEQMPLHLIFNMYALYLVGPFTEQLYGRVRFLAFYLAAATGGSLLSYAMGDACYGVGASGAIFGLFGILVAVEAVHRPMLDRTSRAFLGQVGGLVAVNLLLGFVIGGIDNWAHIGGLVAGLLLGALFAPVNVPSMRSLWVRPGATPGTTEPALGPAVTTIVKVAGLAVLGGLWLVLWLSGSAHWLAAVCR